MGAACCGPLPRVPHVEQRDPFDPDNPIQSNEPGENPEDEQRQFINFQQFIDESAEPIIYEWRFLSEIGKGALSHVYLTKNLESEEICAAKVYNVATIRKPTLGNEEPPYLGVKREIEIMAHISHRYVLSIIEVIEDDPTSSLILIMPYAQCGTLQSVIDKPDFDRSILPTCFFQVAEGLRAIHAEQIVHRDLKPENILAFTEDYFILSDFSVSTRLDEPDQMLEDTKGSPAFLSPEECSGDPFYPKPADVWGYGVTLYVALYGKLPFNLDSGQGCSFANTILVVTQMLQTEELVFPDDPDVDPLAVDLLKRVLQKDPAARPTFEEIIKDPWFDAPRAYDEQLEREQYLNEEEQAIEDNNNEAPT